MGNESRVLVRDIEDTLTNEDLPNDYRGEKRNLGNNIIYPKSWINSNVCQITFTNKKIKANFKSGNTYDNYWNFLKQKGTIDYYVNGDSNNKKTISKRAILEANLMMRAQVSFTYANGEEGNFDILLDNEELELQQIKKYFRKEFLGK